MGVDHGEYLQSDLRFSNLDKGRIASRFLSVDRDVFQSNHSPLPVPIEVAEGGAGAGGPFNFSDRAGPKLIRHPARAPKKAPPQQEHNEEREQSEQ